MEKTFEDIYTYANILGKARNDSYNIYNSYYRQNGNIELRSAFTTILSNYLKNILSEKINIDNISAKAQDFARSMVEHLTGNYEIGTGDVDFEELSSHAENLSNVVAYSNESELNELLTSDNSEQLALGIADGAVAFGVIPSEHQEIAKSKFAKAPEKIKTFFKNSIYNITHLNEKVANAIAHVAKMDSEESKGLNENIAGKAIGGIAYVLLSGTLFHKRHFTPVTNSRSMLDKIEDEGILHFTSPEAAEKILESGKVKKSSFLISDATKKKSFFFAGTPTFEDLLINIPAYDVMTAVRIRPTQEQLQDLGYRAINDRAIVKDGDFEFDRSQAEIVHYGLMYDKEKDSIYFGELTEEEARDFKVSDEVRRAYHFDGKKSSLMDNIKINAYGFYAEYKHHQKLLQMSEILRENGINSFRNVNDRTLVELGDIQQAYISTKDKSVERRGLFQQIKEGLNRKKQQSKDERNEDERNEDEIIH